MKDYYILLRLSRKEYKIMSITEENGIIEIELKSAKNKVRCPKCNQFTSSVHDKLKPIKSNYLDSCGQQVKLVIYKRRFHCYKCNKIFTEQMDITSKNNSISNAVRIQIRIDLMDYNLTFDKIAKKNHVSQYIVREGFEKATSTIPDYLVSIDGEINGFTIPRVSGVNLSTILTTKDIDWKEQIYYLKQVGELLQRLHNIRKYTPLKDIYLNDLHDSNFIVDINKKELKVIDLDSCKICDNKPFASRFLTPMSLLNNSKKYKINVDENIAGYVIADENSDLYCYCIMILNYLFGRNVSSMNLPDFYSYLNYLETININKDLIDMFYRTVTNADNKNPVDYLDSISSEQIYRAKEVVYNKIKKR